MESAAADARWPRRLGLARLPPALAALIVAVGLLGVTWALLISPWQVPDEPQHYAYAESLAQRGALPGDPRRRPMSTAQAAADAAVGASAQAFYPDAVPPDWSPADFAAYQRAAARGPSASDGGGPNSAAANPPLYYLYADVAYWAAGAGDVFDRLYAMRIWTVALLLVTVTAAWLLAGEVLGRRPVAQLACAAVVGLEPAETFISTSVHPDSLMVALWALALWLGARVIGRGGQRRDSVALAAVTSAAILTKATSYALVPAVLLALVMGWRRAPAAARRSAPAQFAAPLAALAGPVLAWLVLAAALSRPAVNSIAATPSARPFNIRQFLSYLWQFYLPRLPFLSPFRETPGLPVYELWIREGWGVFGWRNVPLAGWLYVVLAGVSAGVAAGSAALVVRVRDRRRLELLAFFGVAAIALVGGLHLTDYRAIIAGQPAVIQGRYLLPVLPLLGLAVGRLISRTPRGWRAGACGAVLSGLVLLQVLALATVARSYYT